MFAVIATGGKQYRVEEGSVLRIEKLEVDAGGSVEFEQVLVVGEGASIRIGAPYVTGGKVTATVQANGKADKVHIVKFKRRAHYMRHKGHRQLFTEIKITKIVG